MLSDVEDPDAFSVFRLFLVFVERGGLMEKQLSDCLAQRTAAAAELREYLVELSAEQVTHSLTYGLNTLRNLLFQRIHLDVEANFGLDSMLMPASVEESERLAKAEIDAYQIAITTLAVRDGKYASCEPQWFVKWLGELRLGADLKDSKWRRRIRHYAGATSEDEQRLLFSRSLETVFPEARRAPLILFRLFPLSVRIVAAIAFGHHLDAAELRNKQTLWLSAIADCHDCHGRALDNGEQCAVCGNPVWKYHWLCAD
jgi:hypothetical protein